MHGAVAVRGGGGDVQRKQQGSKGAMDENAFVTCVSVCVQPLPATAALSDALPLCGAMQSTSESQRNMLNDPTTSSISIEATESPETKFNLQLKLRMNSPVPLCFGNSCEKNKPGREGADWGTISIVRRSPTVGWATNGDGGVHDPSIRPGEKREREGGRALREKRQLRRGEGDELKYKGGT